MMAHARRHACPSRTRRASTAPLAVASKYSLRVDATGRFLQVRSVVGRSADLYRGVNVEPATPRAPSPAVPLDMIVAVLGTVAGVSVTHAPTAVVLARGDDEEALRIHVDLDPIALPDLNFEGNPELALLALHALVPMFGAVQLHDGDYVEVVDRTELVAEMVKRYTATLHRPTIGGLDQGDDHVDPPPVRRTRRILTIAVIVTVAIALPLIALWAFRAATRGEPLGATCSTSAQCESGECLSPKPYEDHGRTDGSPMMRAQPSFTNGACTRVCSGDTDCPETMTCADAVQAMRSGTPYATKLCMPRAWVRQ